MVAAVAIGAAACNAGGGSTTAAGNIDPGASTTASSGDTSPSGGQTQTGGELATYRLGVLAETSTDNYWASLDARASVWNTYVLTPTKSALYATSFPGVELINDLAATMDVPTGAMEGEGWAIEVPMREDATWSDGEPVTAHDVAFTFTTVRDLALGGRWLTSYPLPDPEVPDSIGLTAVVPVDDYIVKYVFNARPSLPLWPYGVGKAPVMPAHVWEAAVEEAKSTDDPAAALYGTPGIGLDVSSGPMIFVEREEGSSARTVANASFYKRGDAVRSAGIDYTTGPYIGEAIFSVYDGQDSAVQALKAGEIDYLLSPLGMQRGFLAQVQTDPEIASVVNPTYGFRYLAFNLRKEPMSVQGFRDALALMIDKEFMANNVLQGVAIPMYATMPQGNLKWYNAEVDDSFARQYTGKTIEERLTEAVEILKEAGFSWQVEPSIATDINGTRLNAVVRGEGVMYNGVPVPALEILAPGPGYDPLRATYSIWIETWLNQLGFAAEANPIDFQTLFLAVNPDTNGVMDFDMFILGWDLGDPAFPTYYKSIFYGPNDTLLNGGANHQGYHSDEFDALVMQLDAAENEELAYELMWQMEEVLFRDKPYIILFDAGILEFYRRDSVVFPFTQTLGGLQFIQGMQSLVMAAK